MTDLSSARHQMNVWGDESCSLVRFDLSGRADLNLDDIFHDDVVFLTFQGCGWRSRNGSDKVRHERPGDVIMRRPGESFSIQAEWIARSGGVCREIHVSHKRWAELADQEESPLARIDLAQGLLSNAALAGQLMALHMRFEYAHETLEASEAIAVWLEHLGKAMAPMPAATLAGPCRHGIDRVVDYLRAHFHETILLEDLAQIAQMNRFVLLRQFRDRIGVTPHQYQRIRRVLAAKRCLRDGMPLADIALMCGFFDQSHMTREFKRRTGLTPTAFIPERPAISAPA